MNNCCSVGKLQLGDIIPGTNLRHARINDHPVVVGDHYEDGVRGFHIPVGAVVPLPLLEDMWLVGRLAGKQKNRVKAREIGGVTSDGLFYGSRYFTGEGVWHDSRSWNPDWVEGRDVASEVGVTFP